jgi:hypothetical protein
VSLDIMIRAGAASPAPTEVDAYAVIVMSTMLDFRMVATTTAPTGDLTLVGRSAIVDPVLTLARRLCAMGLILALAAGNGAVCAGWAPTPEARMSCCTESSDCPMHKEGAPHSGGTSLVTQAQADSCCASSESHHSNQSSPTFVVAISSAVLGPGIVVAPTVPALVLSDAWRTAAPIPLAPVPKHVLLSVFLV